MYQNPADLFSMENKVVVITGGAGFLGRQYVRVLNHAGANVVAFDLARREAFSRLDLKSDRKMIELPVDITDRVQIQQATEEVLRIFGRVDVLINNAAMNPAIGSVEAQKMFAPYEEYPEDLWDQEFAVGVKGMHMCIQAVAPIMKEQKSGAIVNIASEVSVAAIDNRIYGEGKYKSPAYIASKTAVVGLTRAWASYLGTYGIRVNAFSPGGMPKKDVPAAFQEKYGTQTMLGIMAQEGDYDGVILFLASDASKRVTGFNLIADAGKTAW